MLQVLVGSGGLDVEVLPALLLLVAGVAVHRLVGPVQGLAGQRLAGVPLSGQLRGRHRALLPPRRLLRDPHGRPVHVPRGRQGERGGLRLRGGGGGGLLPGHGAGLAAGGGAGQRRQRPAQVAGGGAVALPHQHPVVRTLVPGRGRGGGGGQAGGRVHTRPVLSLLAPNVA